MLTQKYYKSPDNEARSVLISGISATKVGIQSNSPMLTFSLNGGTDSIILGPLKVFEIDVSGAGHISSISLNIPAGAWALVDYM